MRTTRAFVLAASILSFGCASDSIMGIHAAAPFADAPRLGSVSLTGFVVLYGESDVRLLTDGIEVQLFGAIENVIPHGGLQVIVYGRFLAAGHFWVDAVQPATAGEVSDGEPDR